MGTRHCGCGADRDIVGGGTDRDREMTPTTVLLPGGYVDDEGVLHREADLVPLSGREEERLAECDPSTPAAFITVLLSCCVHRLGTISPVPTEIVRRLLIADRLYLALKLREATYGGQVQATVQCPWEQCGEKVDIDFWLHDIPVRESVEKGPLHTRELSEEAIGGRHEELYREVTFRLPDGSDQEAISHVAENSETEALELLLARCIHRVGGLSERGPEIVRRLSSLARAELERHMEAAAPSVDLALAAWCPECGREFTVPFDLQRFLLAECRTSREMLYRDVHHLAYHYHWSEQEILALPREKRRNYLALLANELQRASHAV
jgi:hypothetical protein